MLIKKRRSKITPANNHHVRRGWWSYESLFQRLMHPNCYRRAMRLENINKWPLTEAVTHHSMIDSLNSYDDIPCSASYHSFKGNNQIQIWICLIWISPIEERPIFGSVNALHKHPSEFYVRFLTWSSHRGASRHCWGASHSAVCVHRRIRWYFSLTVSTGRAPLSGLTTRSLRHRHWWGYILCFEMLLCWYFGVVILESRNWPLLSMVWRW